MKKKASKKEVKKENKNIQEAIKEQIPEEVKVIFGKFYIFSLIYIIFFAGLFPFYFIYYISLVSQILCVVLLSAFYIYIILDVHKKRKTFMSTIYVILIALVFVAISFSIVKMFI